MNDEAVSVEKPSLGRLVVPSLTVAAFAVNISGPTINLLAVDFARTFLIPTGIVAQLSTVNNGAEAVLALAMGFLTIRFRHRLLLLAGILLVSISALGCFLAPNLLSLQFFFAIEGAGSIMVGIMSTTIIGDYLPLQKKAKAISYITAGSLVVGIVGSLVIGMIANIGGWRPVFLIFILPISVVGLLLTFFSLPHEPRGQQLPGQSSYLTNFRRVLSNRSAASALVATMLGSASFFFVLFALAFYREQFSQPLSFTVVTNMAALSIYIVGNLVAGRLVNRFGTKILIAIGGFVSAGLVTSFFIVNELWLAVAVNMFHAFFSAFALTAGRCLLLDQIPSSRGTMMSLAAIFGNIGGAIGPAVGGSLLFLFSYQMTGVAIGALGVVSTCIFCFLTKDPYKNVRHQSWPI